MRDLLGRLEEAKSRHGRTPYSKVWQESMAQYLTSVVAAIEHDLEKYGYDVTRVSVEGGQAWVYFKPAKGKKQSVDNAPKGDVYVQVNNSLDITAGAHLRPDGFVEVKIHEDLWDQTPEDLGRNILGSAELGERLGMYFW